MSDSARGIIIAVVVLAVVLGFFWRPGTPREERGPCTRLAGNSSVTVYYRQGEGSFFTYSSPDCSSQSRISI
jgi:hypothetical protein